MHIYSVYVRIMQTACRPYLFPNPDVSQVLKAFRNKSKCPGNYRILGREGGHYLEMLIYVRAHVQFCKLAVQVKYTEMCLPLCMCL